MAIPQTPEPLTPESRKARALERIADNLGSIDAKLKTLIDLVSELGRVLQQQKK